MKIEPIRPGESFTWKRYEMPSECYCVAPHMDIDYLAIAYRHVKVGEHHESFFAKLHIHVDRGPLMLSIELTPPTPYDPRYRGIKMDRDYHARVVDDLAPVEWCTSKDEPNSTRYLKATGVELEVLRHFSEVDEFRGMLREAYRENTVHAVMGL